MTKYPTLGDWIHSVTHQNHEVLDDCVKHLDRVRLFDF